MVSFNLNNTFLMLDPGTVIELESVNPILQPGHLPGAKIYPFKLPINPVNQKALGFQENLSLAKASRKNTWESVYCRLHKLPWQRGTLKLRGISEGYYDMTFHTGNGELQLKMENRAMPGLDLGTETVDTQTALVYPDVNHILFPVKNEDFYIGLNTDYKGYVNYYHGGTFKLNTVTNDHVRVPFPFLLHVLNKTFEELGYYGIAGDWTTDAEIRKVVIYNNYSLDSLNGGGVNIFSTDVVFNRHVPDVGISDFIIDVAIFFGIAFVPNEQTGYVDIIRIKDVLNATGFKKVNVVGKDNPSLPNEADGYYFRQTADDTDLTLEQNKDWLTYADGNRKEVIETLASTVNVIDETDSINARDWTVPHVKQPGVSAPWDLGIDNRAPLRFMIYNGMQEDSLTNDYPQGHYATPAMSLRWEGTEGLVALNYAEWMEFKDNTIEVERELRLTIADFLTTDITEKLMADRLVYLLGKTNATISFADGIKPVRATMYKI